MPSEKLLTTYNQDASWQPYRPNVLVMVFLHHGCRLESFLPVDVDDRFLQPDISNSVHKVRWFKMEWPTNMKQMLH